MQQQKKLNFVNSARKFLFLRHFFIRKLRIKMWHDVQSPVDDKSDDCIFWAATPHISAEIYRGWENR
jgi:hypothetical protein